MSKLFYTVLFAAYLCAFHPFEKAQGQTRELKGLEEFHKRDGLPNVFEKIKNTRQVRIAYFGGSITAAESGWRSLTFDWFCLNFPQTAFYQINAAIGGTGSDLGVFRIEKDVIKYRPDLIFIEFAVNDQDQSREKILKAMDGIIRKCWKDNPYLDICFVYTATDKHIIKLVQGEYLPSMLVMEELSEYYGIPSIHMGVEVARLFAADKLILKGKKAENSKTIVFTEDGVHPLAESGHPIYAYVVTKYLDKLQKEKFTFRHNLQQPYIKENWEGAKMLDISTAEKIGEWKRLPQDDKFVQKFSKFMPDIYMGIPGSKLKFDFEGKYLAIYDIIGPGTGILNVNIDGNEQKVMRFDSFCTYYRLGRTVLHENLPAGKHQVEITVLDDKFDKEKMIRDDRIDEFHANPENYIDSNWYPGYFLIIE